MSFLDNTLRIPKFGGKIYYVSQSTGNDSYDGLVPERAFATIGQALSTMVSGDATVIRAGVYTETGLDLNCDSCELWFEIGAILRPATGTALTISGNYCRVICREGALLVDPAGAGTTAVLVTGNFAYLSEIRAKCDSVAAIGYDLQGDGADIRNCRCSNPTTAAFKVQGDLVILEGCCLGGDTGENAIGIWITNSCDKARVRECSTQGFTTAGFQIDAGCTNAAICGGMSGGGDGKFINNATTGNCIFSDLHYQGDSGDYNSPIVKVVTFTATGGQDGDGLHYRLFKVSGTVRMVDIGASVTTLLPATSTVPNLELTSANATIEMTDDTGGPDISGAVVGALLIRLDVAAEPLYFANPDSTPAVAENTSKFTDRNVIEIVEDDNADTYVTLRLTAALASGAMIWACRYDPLTPDGFMEPA